MEEEIIPEFLPKLIYLQSSIIILGPPGSGKSSFVEYIANSVKKRVPVVRVLCSPPIPHRRYCSIFPPIFIFSKFDLNVEEEFINRQKKQTLLNSKGKHCLYIIDDLEKESKGIFSTPYFENLFKQGTRHWSLLTIICNQYALDLSPTLRSAATLIIVSSKYNSQEDLRKIFNNFGSSLFDNIKHFQNVMKTINKKQFAFLVIDNRRQRYFWATSEPQINPVNNKFGCTEIWDYNTKHLNKSKSIVI